MTEVCLVGTNHVSDESAARVRRAIREEEPDVVAVELCPRRYDEKVDSSPLRARLAGRALDLSWHAFAVETALTLYQWKLSRDRLDGDHDMMAAIKAAARLGVPVALVDAPVDETMEALSRALWADFRRIGCRPRHFYRTTGELKERADELASHPDAGGDLSAALESASPSELDRLLEPVAEVFPRSFDVLFERRNETMAGRLHALSGDGTAVVGVVGRGHLSGVRRLLDEPERITAEALEDPPLRDPAADVEVTDG